MRSQDPVPPVEIADRAGDDDKYRIDQLVDMLGQGARHGPGHDQRADNAAGRRGDEHYSDGRGHTASGQRNDHVSPRTGDRVRAAAD